MKINGQRIDTPAEVIVPVIRGETELIFKAGAVLDFSEFDAMCPVPKPPMIQRKGESEPSSDFTDKKFQAAADDYARKRSDYMIIKSLSVTPNLEWELVNPKDPLTFNKYEEEFKAAGLNQFEIGRLINAVMEANGLDDKKIEEAKKRFLASQAAAQA